MGSMDLPKMSTARPKSTCRRTDSGRCSNHLQQRFSQDAPDLVRVSDITYLRAGGKWYYLCVIIDLFSRKVISWHLSGKADVSLVITVFQKAYACRNSPCGLMFHSDRGTQYTAFAFRQLLDSLNVVQLDLYYKSRHLYALSVTINYTLNRRLHSSLDYLTPNEMEDAYRGRSSCCPPL